MSYIINKTNGDVLTEVVDGSIDQLSTDVTLVGKNSSSYGELFNENFIKLLENFANTTQPNYPIEGQLWYDTTEARLKIYDGTGFKVSGGTIVSSTVPSSIAQGDIWIDSLRKQLYFNDGSQNILAGPLYTYQQGISGFQTLDLLDTNNIQHTILVLYVGQVLLGVFSNSEFTPLNDSNISSVWSGVVKKGFTVTPNSSVKFNVPASQADSLIAEDGSAKTAEAFLQVSPTDGYTVANGQIRILKNQALLIGANQNTEIKIDSSALQINSNVINQNFQINSFNSSGLLPSIHVSAGNALVGIYTSTPTHTLDVNGDARIRGDLIVEGATTTINTTNLAIEDLLIELGKVASPSNSTANGGGIKLIAGSDVDKTLSWSSTSEAWDSSENVNLVGGKVFKIANYEVLSQTQLGYTVISAPGLKTVGELDDLQVKNLYFIDSTISFLNPSIGTGTITLTPKGAGISRGTVDVSSSRISSVSNPVDLNDAVNLSTLTAVARTAPQSFTVNIGVQTEQQLAVNVIAKVFPPALFDENTELRVWCLDTDTAKYYKLISEVWTYQSDL